MKFKFFFFSQFLQVDKFEGVDFKHKNTVFEFQLQHICVKAFLVRNLGILVFGKNLQIDKFEGADFKNGNVVFKFLPKNCQIIHLGSII